MPIRRLISTPKRPLVALTVLLSIAPLATCSLLPSRIRSSGSARSVLSTFPSKVAGPAFGRSLSRRINYPKQQRTRFAVRARLDDKEREKAAELAKKMKKAGWDWPITEVLERYDWEEVRRDLEMSPVDAFSMVVSALTFFKAAGYMAATYVSFQLAEGLADRSDWSYVVAACAGYFGVGVLRMLLQLRAQSALTKEIMELNPSDELMLEVLRNISDKRIQEQMGNANDVQSKADRIEWDPEGLLPPRQEGGSIFDDVEAKRNARGTGDDTSRDGDSNSEGGGAIAAMERRRAAATATGLRERVIEAVEKQLEENLEREQSSALGAISSLDSMMAGFGADNSDSISAEALGVTEEAFSAAERVFSRFDDNDTGRLGLAQMQEILRRYGLPALGDREIKILLQTMGAADDRKLTKDEFLKFWARGEEETVSETATTTLSDTS
mmetsp:Transcript_2682/g.6184  ORF Transcript_2682/g.6184 Transcript_2682/m.6184 type:complete len:441 (+) Transcript_2682:133-1455(+)